MKENGNKEVEIEKTNENINNLDKKNKYYFIIVLILKKMKLKI